MVTSPPSPGDPEPDLLRGVQAGAPDAIDAWYRAEHPEVYRLCFGFLAHGAEAEDCAQEAMLRLLDRLSDWNPDRSYRAWRTTVVLNGCRDRLRRAAARRRAEDGALLERSEKVLPDPHSVIEQAEVQELLSQGLRSLSPRERETFVLRDLEGLATPEVARILDIGESSVRSLLSLARRRLRQLYGERIAPGGQG